MEEIQTVLGWCTLINCGVFLFWFAVFILGHSWLRRLHGRWFSLSSETFDAIHYGLMGAYELAIFLFNLVPYLALRIAS